MINQLITCLRIEVVAEGLIPAERAGIDPRRIQQALKGRMHMISCSYEPGGKVKTQLKNLKMALDLADSISARLPHLDSTTALY